MRCYNRGRVLTKRCRAQGAGAGVGQLFIITVSDTRTEATDASGRAIADLLTAAGHQVAGRTIVRTTRRWCASTIERQLAYRARR